MNHEPTKRFFFLELSIIFCIFLFDCSSLFSGIHTAPVVIPGKDIRVATQYPINFYRVFRRDPSGVAVPIAFQIDEINEWGDYVLQEGSENTGATGNNIFDAQDELVFMGDEVGEPGIISKWPENKKPLLVYEVILSLPNAKEKKLGAVYIAIYASNPPPLSQKKYVSFSPKDGIVQTSRYEYIFDKKNFITAEKISMYSRLADGTVSKQAQPLVDSSTFYLKADMKYFLTLKANQYTLNSKLDAYKIGPVRAITRISFFYRILKMNFEVGMYTEVSFFPNAVVLPTIFYNPLNGNKSLNMNSGFYYGFGFRQSPESYQLQTNMSLFKESTILSEFLSRPQKVEPLYWFSAQASDHLIYMEIVPSKQMKEDGATPYYYLEPNDFTKISNRSHLEALELGKSPVNFALYFDLTKFREGEHLMSFRLFFENYLNPDLTEMFRTLSMWQIQARRMDIH